MLHWEPLRTSDTYEVLALYGTNGLSEEHLKAVSALKDLSEVILFLDGDPAGKKAVEIHSQTLKALMPDIKVSHVETPENEDINSLLQGHSTDIFIHLIENRKAFFFSNEKEKVSAPTAAAPETASTQQSDKAIQQPGKTRFETSNPNNLVYKGTGAQYSIRGGIKGGLESLKVSIQINPSGGANGQDYRSKVSVGSYFSFGRPLDDETNTMPSDLVLASQTALR
jgi:DNA primase